MSVNLSLGDTPGVSAYFDGQPIQDELEAEIRREEERQQKELRDLLATELEDFEEDFLSDSNSEEDSVNVSRVSRASSHSHRHSRQHEQQKALQAQQKLIPHASDSTGSNKALISDSSNDGYYSPHSRNRSNSPIHQGLMIDHSQNLVQQQQHLHGLHSNHHHLQHSQESNQNHLHHQGQFVPSSQYDSVAAQSQGVVQQSGDGNNVFHTYGEDEDDWMMRVQQTHTATSSPHPSQSVIPHQYPLQQHQQQQQQQQQQQHFYSPIPHHNNTGIGDSPSLPAQRAFHNPVIPSPLVQPSNSNAVLKPTTPIHSNPPDTVRDRPGQKAVGVPDNTDDYDNYQVQYKSKPKRNDVNENDFYIHNENVEFFRADGDEEKRSYQQLEVLYRARGRELEDLTWKLKQAEEEAAKETRMYKHKLALANGDFEGGQESLRQCQSLLQQTKSDLAESQALVRTLETQVTSLKEAREELIKKLQVAESTIENLSHQCEELQQSESLSRARNEHESVVASLTQRFERELLSIKEKLDETKSGLEAKHEETVWLKKQLADSTKELEQAQISRGETINRLAKSLEDSQRQCQALLEQSSSQEIASLKVKLQQNIASKSVSEETCIGLQSEIKELKEQLSMFEAASALGAVSSVSRNKLPGPCLDDSMTDLGIKKILDFDTPSSTPKLADSSSLEELVTSLRSELEKCLHSNRQKRAEIAEKSGEITLLKQELHLSQSKSQDLEKACFDQKIKLKDLESLVSNSNGGSILEVRLRRDVEALSKEKAILLEEIEDYKKRLEEVGASESKLTEINTELSAQIAQMVSDFDSDKASALDRCQRTLEEVHHMTLNNVRAGLEDRLASEKSMMAECHKMELDKIKVQLDAAQEEAHSVKSLYINTCDEMKKQEEETRALIRKEVEEELASVSRCKEEAKETVAVREERDRHLGVEEHFAKEKSAWTEEKELYLKEIKSSKDIIADINAGREKDISELQDTISNLDSQHKEELDALNNRLTNLTSCHQSEMKKMQEESNSLSEMKLHFETKLELVEKQFKAEKEELTSKLQQEKKLRLLVGSSVETNSLHAESKDTSAQTEEFKEGSESEIDDSLRTRLVQMQAELKSIQEEHLTALENLKAEHKKEFDRAARSREEKFQVELRYFLKEKEEKFKEKLDQALKKCEEDATFKSEKAIKEKEMDIERLRKELDNVQLKPTDGQIGAVAQTGGEVMSDVVKRLNAEKAVIERKIQDLEQQKVGELSSIVEKHANEEKALIEKYENEIRVLTLNHKTECEELHQEIKELQDEQRKDTVTDNMKDDDDMRKVVSARVREERARWFKEAQEYIKNEIESGIADREQRRNNNNDDEDDDAWARKLNEEVKRNVETELDRMKAKMELEIEQEVDQRVREQLAKEVKRLKTEQRKKEGEDKKMVDMQVKEKLSVEVENLKIKFLSELEARVAKEKDQLEQDVKKWKEDMKEKIEGDKKMFVAQLNRDMEMKISEERKKVRVEIMQDKQEELRQLRIEMEEEMRKRIEREKMDWQREEEESKKRMKEGEREDDYSASVVRDRLRAAEEACHKAYSERERAVELLKIREASYKKDKEKLVAGLKQLRQDLDATKEEQAVLEEKYAQMDRKYKEDMKDAKKKKDLALEKLHAKCEEEKENIIVDYKNQIASMKEDFRTEMDKVRSEAEMERAALLMELRSHAERALTLSPMQEPDTEATSLFELRNHYLETVSKIKEDVMSHVQAANSRAATTMKTEMRKQRRRLIQVFKERCKSSVRSILTGQVSTNVLNSLDQAIDMIAEVMVTTPKSATSNATTWSPSSIAAPGNSTPRDHSTPHDHIHIDPPTASGEKPQQLHTKSERRHRNVRMDDDDDVREAEKINNPVVSSEQYRDDIRNRQGVVQPLKHHPQLAKVDLYDSEAIDSSPQTSHHSSPASLHTKSIYHTTSKMLSSPPVPRLNLSPFHAPKEAEHSVPVSEDQQRRALRSDGYSRKTKQSVDRPRSAESTKVPQSHGVPHESGEPSPRERMKVIEAQVRLANWAASGEMPWKGTNSKRGALKQKDVDLEGEDSDNNLFVRPGEEAERFLKAQRSMKKIEGDLVTPLKKNKADVRASPMGENNMAHQKRPMEIDGYMTDDSNGSSESHTSSFVTLEPDVNQKSHLGTIQDRHGKNNSTLGHTTDFDRIKSAVFEHPNKSYMNITHRRSLRMQGEASYNVPSDDDARSVDSDAPEYGGLPTSTPLKRSSHSHEHHIKSHSASAKIVPDRQKSAQHWDGDSDSSAEREAQDWKTVNVFSNFPEPRTHHHKSHTTHPPHPPSKQGGSRRQMDITKSVDFEFPDISEITQASGDGGLGGGRDVWRCKSLEDLLPHQARGRREALDQTRNYSDKSATGYSYRKRNLSIPKTAPPPIQAMDSDFWREQSMEDEDHRGEYDKRLDHPHYSGPSSTHYHQNIQHKKHQQQQQAHQKTTHSSVNNRNKHHDGAARHKKGQVSNSRHHANPQHTESTWSEKRSHHRNPMIGPPPPADLSYNTPPPPDRNRNNSAQRQHNPLPPSYSSPFDTHVDDLRKSLESAEANSFFSMMPAAKHTAGGKSKMKRSVSEQSLHTIQWDQAAGSADIDDLVNAYTTGTDTALSHFDLHNFGHEEAF